MNTYGSAAIVLTLAISVALPAQAAAFTLHTKRDTSEPSLELGQRCSRTGGDAHGIKSRIIREFTESLAKAIREGGDIVGWIIGRLDGSAAKAFRKHAKKIADELDRIAQIPDLTTRIVREKLYNSLRNDLGLSGGTALQIADVVYGALNFLLF